MVDVYNPLDKRNLGKSVADALLDQRHCRLDEIMPFEGAGVYVLYYSGGHPAYGKLAVANADRPIWPIYIGKAIPSGGRRGASLEANSGGTALYKRLYEHRESIQAVERHSGALAIADFSARFLVVDDIWIPLGESLMISRFRPVWNIALEGFGNHDPGKGRYSGLKPLWDHFHPGRIWAERCALRDETDDQIVARIQAHLQDNPC